MISTLKLKDLEDVLLILKQDVLRYCDGRYPEASWIGHLITNSSCFALGLFETDDVLTSVLLAEKLSYGGCMLWYIATAVDKQNLGYGSALLHYFESYAKDAGVTWIFLNATQNSFGFYNKHKFLTGATVREYVKDI